MHISYQKRLLSYFIDIILGQIILRASLFFFALTVDSLYLAQIISFIFWGFWILFNFPFLQSSNWKASIGQKILGIKVVDIYGNNLSFWRACYRGCILTFCPWGSFMYFFSPHKQCLHDFFCDSIVVKEGIKTNHPRPLQQIKYSIIIIFLLVSFLIPLTLLVLSEFFS